MNNKFKDSLPHETVNKIRNILYKLNIFVKEKWQSNPINDIYSVRLEIIGTKIGANGKGTTEEYALASAYAEFMERLLNGVLFSNWTTVGNEIFVISPDEEALIVEEYYKDNLIFDNIIKELNLPNRGISIGSISELRNNMHEKMNRIDLIKNIYAEHGKLLSIYFKNLSSEEKIPIPYRLLKNVYGSNGMASGNTYEETLVQAISEIFERYCLKQIILNNVVPPDIPMEVLRESFPNIYEYIVRIEAKGNYYVRVRDCSLGLGLPVVCTTLSNRSNQTSITDIGSHPDISIALERTFTEIFQGREFDQGWNAFSQHNNIEKYNIISLFRNSIGHYPDKFYSKNFSYAVDLVMISKKFSSNLEMLSYFKELCKRNNFEIFLRQNNDLGFSAVHVIIPGMSEICNYDEIAYNIDLMSKKAFNVLSDTKEFSTNEILETLEFFNFSRKLSLLDVKFSRNYKMTKDHKENYNLYILMIRTYYKIGYANKAMNLISDLLLKDFSIEQNKTLKCLLNLFEIIVRNSCSKSTLHEILMNFYDREIVDNAIDIIFSVDNTLDLNKIEDDGFSDHEKNLIVNLKKDMLSSNQRDKKVKGIIQAG